MLLPTRAFLESASLRRLRVLADDPAFVERVGRSVTTLDLGRRVTPCGASTEHPIAYFNTHTGPDWMQRVAGAGPWEQIDAIPDSELWATRARLRQRLVDYLRAESIRDRLSRGEAAEYVEAAARVFDPNVLTVGFARRVATYKRRRGVAVIVFDPR